MGFQYHSTPKKARVQGTIAYLQANRIPHFKIDVFRFHGMSKASGWRALQQLDEEDGRTYHSVYPDRRGRRKKIIPEILAQIERFIDTARLDIDVYADTVRRVVKDLNLRIYLVYEKKYISPQLRERRADYTCIILKQYPDLAD
ncbi:hypothetical protein C8A01DRAFT_38066 [Parachaetomium inaequale]|uniref:Uncharacterized protein n=1 Tax=Parachaetomium inaequale TaxID=2588326 RepID=A0AAN6PDE8_9PEZI|nr:hypothetical protein C8A01DRAFT_38066 [Parachaetomium inaequale]